MFQSHFDPAASPPSPFAPLPSPLEPPPPLFGSSVARPGLAQPPAQTAPLVEGIARYLLRKEQIGDKVRTLKDIREQSWLLLEFLQEAAVKTGRGGAHELRIADLPAETGARWLDWLRTTKSYRRRRGSYPTQFTMQSVEAFYTYCTPPKRWGGLRNFETVGKAWRTVSAMLRWLGLPVEVERYKRRHYRRLPPIVPQFEELAARWREVLTTGRGRATPAERRIVVWTQGLILLWGTRVHEALPAQIEDVQEHWSLVGADTKTGPRLTYFNARALGLIAALRGQKIMPWAGERWSRVSGWPWCLNKWHALVRDCGIDDGPKPQQGLRRRFSEWVKVRDAEVEMLLAGHGGNVIFTHYLDVLRRVPPVMEQLDLPDVDAPGFTWPAPVWLHRPPQAAEWTAADESAAAQRACPPRDLYGRFDRWRAEQELLAAQPR